MTSKTNVHLSPEARLAQFVALKESYSNSISYYTRKLKETNKKESEYLQYLAAVREMEQKKKRKSTEISVKKPMTEEEIVALLE